MKAFKFLAKGAVGPISGFRWPAPGAWVEVDGALQLCSRGVHVCREFDLAHWLHDELWEAEIEGEVLEGVDCLVARGARLVHRVEAWSEGGAARFARACIEHAAALAGPAHSAAVAEFLQDAEYSANAGFTAGAAFCTAQAVARLNGSSPNLEDYRGERAWQSGWIAREVISPR